MRSILTARVLSMFILDILCEYKTVLAPFIPSLLWSHNSVNISASIAPRISRNTPGALTKSCLKEPPSTPPDENVFAIWEVSPANG